MNKLYPGSIKCKKPKMTDRNGRTWDYCKVIFTDGTEHEGYLDTTWGHYFYFHIMGEKFSTSEWRKMKHEDFPSDGSSLVNIFDFRKLKKLNWNEAIQQIWGKTDEN